MREAEVVHGPEKDMRKTEVVLPVIEIPTTEPLKQMIGSGMIAGSVEGIPVQNGLTTLNQVSVYLCAVILKIPYSCCFLLFFLKSLYGILFLLSR